MIHWRDQRLKHLDKAWKGGGSGREFCVLAKPNRSGGGAYPDGQGRSASQTCCITSPCEGFFLRVFQAAHAGSLCSLVRNSAVPFCIALVGWPNSPMGNGGSLMGHKPGRHADGTNPCGMVGSKERMCFAQRAKGCKLRCWPSHSRHRAPCSRDGKRCKGFGRARRCRTALHRHGQGEDHPEGSRLSIGNTVVCARPTKSRRR